MAGSTSELTGRSPEGLLQRGPLEVSTHVRPAGTLEHRRPETPRLFPPFCSVLWLLHPPRGKTEAPVSAGKRARWRALVPESPAAVKRARERGSVGCRERGGLEAPRVGYKARLPGTLRPAPAEPPWPSLTSAPPCETGGSSRPCRDPGCPSPTPVPSPRPRRPQGLVRVVYTGWSQLPGGLWAGGTERPLSRGEA